MFKVTVFLVSLFFFAGSGWRLSAGTAGCGCYCGKTLPPPCSDEACKTACGWTAPAVIPAADASGEEEEAAREKERRENQRRLEKKAREEKKRKEAEEFLRNKEDAVKGLKDADFAKPDLKGLDACSEDSCGREALFGEYREREEERAALIRRFDGNAAVHKGLKPRADWCKLNIPLPPSEAAACYCGKKKIYEQRMARWRVKCAAAAEPLPAGAVPSKRPAVPGKDFPAFCLGVYDGEVKPCAGALQAAAACINNALGVYLRCVKGEVPDPGGGTK